MRVLNAVRRLLLMLLAIPAVAIVVDVLLGVVNAQENNPIVRGIDRFADNFILPEMQSVFARPRKQTDFQDALVALIALALLALVIVFVFRALRAVLGARPPKVQPAPAKKPRAAAPPEQTTPNGSAKPASSPSDETAATPSATPSGGTATSQQQGPPPAS